MRQTKRIFPLFTFYDRTGIEAFLEKQAQNGWLLDKTSSLSWRFRRIEPRRLRFSVTYFPQATAFDPAPSDKQLMFRDFCEHTGWRLAASSAQMEIFYNEADDPVPIETDPLVELENIHKSVKRSYLPTYFILLFNGLLQTGMQIWRLSIDPIAYLANDFQLLASLLWLLVIATTAAEIASYFLWRRRAKRLAEESGEFFPTRGRSNMQIFGIILMLLALALMIEAFGGAFTTAYALIMVGGILAIGAVVLGISAVMKRRMVPSGTNRGVTIALSVVLSFAFSFVVLFAVIFSFGGLLPDREPDDTYEFGGITFEIYRDELPLRIEDLLETDYEGYSTQHEIEESLLLCRFRASQRPRMGDLGELRLSYSVLQVKLPALYGWCAEISLDGFAVDLGLPSDHSWESAVRVDASPWGANEAYRLYRNGEPTYRFLLFYDGRIVVLVPDWELTGAQKAIVGEKLGGAG